jgi:predicted dehydrogenase
MATTNGHHYQTFGSVEELAACPEIDIIYVASPHSEHEEHVRACLMGGRNVLCEKAFTLTAKQASGLIAIAREKNLFLMEAMWMRYLPAVRALVETHLPRIGQVCCITHRSLSLSVYACLWIGLDRVVGLHRWSW